MGLKETFQSAASQIIDGFGNVATTGLAYHSLGTFSYDPATGTNTESGDTDTTIKTIFDDFVKLEIVYTRIEWFPCCHYVFLTKISKRASAGSTSHQVTFHLSLLIVT